MSSPKGQRGQHDPRASAQHSAPDFAMLADVAMPGTRLCGRCGQGSLGASSCFWIKMEPMASSGCQPCYQPGFFQQSLLTWPSCSVARLRSHKRTAHQPRIMRQCCQLSRDILHRTGRFMHMISRLPETEVVLNSSEGAAPADGLPVAALFVSRAPFEGTAVPAVPSSTSGLVAALAASDAACKHHASA